MQERSSSISNGINNSISSSIRIKKTWRVGTGLFILGLILSFLSPTLQAKGEEPPLNVVVSIKPLKLLMQAFLGDSARVYQLIPDGLTPHDFQLKLSDLQKIKSADLVIWLGADAEPYLVKLLQQHSTPRIDALNINGIIQLPYRDLDQWHQHSEVLDHDRNRTAHNDIHFWLSLANNRILVGEVAGYLVQRNLMPAAIAKTKQQKMETKFISIEKSFPLKDTSSSRRLLVYHDAFQYLEKELQLHNLGAVVADVESGVGLKRLLRLKKRVQRERIDCVLTTPSSNHKILKKIFANVSYRTAEIDILAVNASLNTFEKYWLKMIEEVNRCVGQEGHST